MNRHDHLRLAALLATLLLLAACGPAATPAPGATATSQAAASLEGTEWALFSLQGSPLLAGTHISLTFRDGQAGGFAGCNAYGGGYEAKREGTLSIPEMAITAMACPSPEGVMDQEQAYIRALGSAATYLITNGHLEIENTAGEAVLVFSRQEAYGGDPAGLVGTAWRLVSLDGQTPIAGSVLTLAFHDERLVSGHAGCRDYLATYQAEGGDLGFPYTAMMGPDCAEDALLLQEGAYTTVLGWTAHYRLTPDQLELSTIRGEILAFEPLPREAQPTLEGPTWSLLAFVEPNPYDESPYPAPLPDDVLAATEITAVFAGGAVRGSTGCNSYDGAYGREGDALTVGPIAVTEMACLDPAGLMEQEGRFLGLLARVTAHHIYGDQLWLETDDGRALVFRAGLPGGGSTPPTEPEPTSAGLVLQAGGLGMVHFGEEAGAVIETLTGILGAPDYDSGWLDPSLPANEPLWPGCPGTTARLLSWHEPGLSIVLTDWAQNDLQNPGDARASTGSPYFAGYGVGAAEPPQLRTSEGAYPGLALPELQELFGARLFVSPEPDEAVGLYWFAIDGTGSPLSRMGGIRGWLFEPDINSPDYQPGLVPGEAFESRGFTVGLSCSTP